MVILTQKAIEVNLVLDFCIDYKVPLSAGGKTQIDNLQLVYSTSSKNLAWENMSLSDIEQQDPALYKKICDDVYRYYQLRNGNYYDATNGKRSYIKSDFKIEYKTPLSQGGKTMIENLYLAYQKPKNPVTPPAILPPADNFQAVDDMINQIGTATDKLALKNNVLNSLGKIASTAQQNKDVDALKTAAIYYGKIHEHSKAEECEKLAKSLNSATPATSTTFTNSNGGNISGTNLTWQLDDSGTLTISGNGDMLHDGYSTENPWQGKKDLIKKVIIESGVTSIGDLAFNMFYGMFGNDQTNLQTVEILGNITKVGKCAFCGCYALKEIKLPESVTKIDKGAFDKCSSLTEIIIPKSVRSIENDTFCGCSKLKKVILPASVKEIEKYAFSYCESLEIVEILGSLDKIGSRPFYKCSNLKIIKYPRGIHSRLANNLGEGNKAELIPY